MCHISYIAYFLAVENCREITKRGKELQQMLVALHCIIRSKVVENHLCQSLLLSIKAANSHDTHNKKKKTNCINMLDTITSKSCKSHITYTITKREIYTQKQTCNMLVYVTIKPGKNMP